MGKAMEIGVLGLVLLSFVSLHLVAAEVFSTATPAFVWSDLRCGFAFWVELLFGGTSVFFHFRV